MKYYNPRSFLLISLFSITIVFGACGGHAVQEDASDAGTSQEEFYPKSPQEVVRRYQAYLDSNRFELAQKLSTPRSAPLHEMMAAIVADTPFDSSLIHTEFLKINCEPGQDTIICVCTLRDEYEEYESEYILVKANDRWLVDIPDEEGDFELFEKEMLEEWPENQ